MAGLKAEDIRGALAPFKEIAKSMPVEIDLHSVAVAVAEDVAKATDAEDAEAGLDKLVKRVDQVDAFLQKVSCPEEGDALYAPAGDPLTAEFAKAADEDEEDEEEDGKPPWMKRKGKKKAESAEAPTQKNADGDGVAFVNQDDGQGDKWDLDLSPKKPPVQRAERLTKREVPVAARPGSQEHADAKYQRARDRAMGRDDGRATRPAAGG